MSLAIAELLSDGTEWTPLNIAKDILNAKGLIVLEEKILTQLDIPDSIEKTILGNLKRLPEEISNFLNLASLIGKEFDLESIKFLSGYDEEKIFEALFTLLKERILTQAQNPPKADFYHF